MIQQLSENDPKLIPTIMRARMRSRARSAACETPVRYRGIAKVLGRDPEVQQQFFRTALGNPCGPSVVSWRALEVRRKLLGVSLGGPWNSGGVLWTPLWCPWGHWGCPSGSLGAPWGILGSPWEVFRATCGVLRVCLWGPRCVFGGHRGLSGHPSANFQVTSLKHRPCRQK